MFLKLSYIWYLLFIILVSFSKVTFKILTLTAAIEEGVVDIFEDHYYDSGSINVNGTKLHCWKSKGHKDQTFLEVVENSCNLV